MLPDHLLNLVHEQITSDLETKGTSMRNLRVRAAEKAQITGMIGNVGAHFTKACMEEIETRANLVATAIRTVFSEVRISPYEGLTDDLLAVFDASCSSMLGEFRPKISEGLRAMGINGDGGTEADISKYLMGPRMDVKRLSAAILEPARQAEQTIITISHSQVGLIQSGKGATASGAITITQNDARELSEALRDLREKLAEHPELNSERRAEVVEIVQEIEREVEKPNPNKTKTGGLLSTVMASIRGLSDIGKAAEVLKRIGEQLGYYLQF